MESRGCYSKQALGAASPRAWAVSPEQAIWVLVLCMPPPICSWRTCRRTWPPCSACSRTPTGRALSHVRAPSVPPSLRLAPARVSLAWSAYPPGPSSRRRPLSGSEGCRLCASSHPPRFLSCKSENALPEFPPLWTPSLRPAWRVVGPTFPPCISRPPRAAL